MVRIIIVICFFLHVNVFSQTSLNNIDISYLKNKKIIGIGECIHGASSLLSFEQEFLFKINSECGFTNIAFELPYESTFSINEYMKGKISSDSLCKDLQFYFYQTHEFISFLNDIKTFNIRKNTQIHVFGIDMQNKDLLVRQLINDYEIINQNKLYKLLVSIKKLPDYDDLNIISCKNSIDSLYYLFSLELNYLKANGLVSTQNLLSLQNLYFWFQLACAKANAKEDYIVGEIRDSCMAEMLLHLYSANITGVLFVGHNYHVGYGSHNYKKGMLGINTTGNYLRNKIGSDYYSFGSESFEATFIAKRYKKEDNKYCIDNFFIRNKGRNNFGRKLNDYKKPLLLINYKDFILPNKRYLVTGIGGTFEKNTSKGYFLYPKLLNDGVIFIKSMKSYRLISLEKYCN